jgi:DNA sulfur modification protein DndB
MSPEFEYVFPSIRGVQAGHEFYVSMCPLKLIPKIFIFNEEELVPHVRAQRILNKARLPEMARYVLDNPKSYVFSALTASIDGEVNFEPLGESVEDHRMGSLRVPMDSQVLINDGQHRRAAIEIALRENPDLGTETIAVVFFLDLGMKRCQQMFADLNRHAVRATRSIGILYDHRDEAAGVVKEVVLTTPCFDGCVEMERSTLAARSRKLFTLSAIYTATITLLKDVQGSHEDLVKQTVEFWEHVARQLPEWKRVQSQKMTSAEVRQAFIHSHGIALHALARVGNQLLTQQKRGWKKTLNGIKTINWKRSNARLWEGRAMTGGRVSKAGQNVMLTTNAIKKHLGLRLTADETRVERLYARGKSGKQEEK